MKIGLITRKSEHQWGGDLAALHTITRGLAAIGQEVLLGKTAEEVIDADFIFLHNTSYDLKPDYALLSQHNKPFGVIAVHADRSLYYSTCYAFAHFVGLCLEQDPHFPFYSLNQLIETPEILDLFPYSPPPLFEDNIPILQAAKICIANSATEAATLERDAPGCKTAVIPLACDLPALPKTDCFLKWMGLSTGEYVLQVGRLELRKNQLATILAMRDSPLPLVLIATKSFYPDYEKMCLQAIRKYRKAPTLLISQNLPATQEKHLQILPMPRGEKLPEEQLISAYQNAGLHVHPAFCELPGLTYLEAAKLGVPTIASPWTTIDDYFTDSPFVYVLPHYLQELTQAIELHFGKRVDPHALQDRTCADVACDLLIAIDKIASVV